jgi:superfamily II DNA or RNA helicase
MNKIINSSGFKFSWKNYTTKPDKRSDDYFDMRKWQKHAFDVLHSNKYMILNAPTGSGKSWLICLLSDFKLRKNNNLRCIITVPQTIIANGFAEANLITPDEEKIPWFAQHNLCNDVEQDGNINYVIKWLEGPYGFFFDKILICTHATLVGVYKQLKKTKRLKLLNFKFGAMRFNFVTS